MLQYHHNRSLASIIFGEVKADPKYTHSYDKGVYLWLEKEVGFYPLFVSIGITEEDIYMTGYQQQWAKVIGSRIVERKPNENYIYKNILRKKGESPNEVLFSFKDVDGIFMEYERWWGIVFNAGHKDYKITEYEKRLIFKKSWPKSKWLRKSREDTHSVQLITPKLYLPNAKRIWCRNKQTKKLLEFMGFKNIEVKRIPVEYPE